MRQKQVHTCFWGLTRYSGTQAWIGLKLNRTFWFVGEITLEIASQTLAGWISSFFKAPFSIVSPGFALVTERSIYCPHRAYLTLRALKDFYCERMETFDESSGFGDRKICYEPIAPRLKCPRGWQAYCPFQRLNSFRKIFSPGGCNCVCEMNVHSAWATWFECFLVYVPLVDWALKDLPRFPCTNAN